MEKTMVKLKVGEMALRTEEKMVEKKDAMSVERMEQVWTEKMLEQQMAVQKEQTKAALKETLTAEK